MYSAHWALLAYILLLLLSNYKLNNYSFIAPTLNTPRCCRFGLPAAVRGRPPPRSFRRSYISFLPKPSQGPRTAPCSPRRT
ncbi:hypothetical protein DFH09DRAFT_115382 [Mycena vulgaris]|nr:hypothetical protein DFH09DRAFT_115382 [Mycena vulgaris]